MSPEFIGQRCRELLREIARSKEMAIYAGSIKKKMGSKKDEVKSCNHAGGKGAKRSRRKNGGQYLHFYPLSSSWFEHLQIQFFDRAKTGLIWVRCLISVKNRTDTFIGENFQQQRVRHPAINNMGLADACGDGIQTALNLWNHAACNGAVINHAPRFSRA